jgi:hypothetical protein
VSLLDGRHKWDEGVRADARITYTCRACGRTAIHELLIPDAILDALVRSFSTPNPYRALFR